MIRNISINRTYSNYYIFNSRILTHIAFWVIYYIGFSLVWSQNHGVFGSFFLELLLLPMRILATYAVIYWSMPNFLLKKKLLSFLASLVLILLVCGILQRFSIYFFYEEFLNISKTSLFDPKGIFRSIVLINTTVMLGMTIKFYGIYQDLVSKINSTESEASNIIEVKSDRRVHLVDSNQIIYIKGLGNYIKIFRATGSELTSYIPMKTILESLNNDFIRVHKSFIINKKYITSFTNEDIHVGTQSIPRGKNVRDEDLKI